jgi:hypothetical protein
MTVSLYNFEQNNLNIFDKFPNWELGHNTTVKGHFGDIQFPVSY